MFVNCLLCALDPKLLPLSYLKGTLKIKRYVVEADSCDGDKTATMLT
jgi:hypothetical protein